MRNVVLLARPFKYHVIYEEPYGASNVGTSDVVFEHLHYESLVDIINIFQSKWHHLVTKKIYCL